MHVVIVAVIGLVVIGLLGWLAWVSVQSLMQAGVLRSALPLHQLKDNVDRPVSVYGEPELSGPYSSPFGFPVIWYKKMYQEYRRSGKHGSWRTISTEERINEFSLSFPEGGRVLVCHKPTEIQGKIRRTDRDGFWSRSRIVYEWLPANARLTVLGKLVVSREGATVTTDPKLGLLFSNRTPQGAAMVETAKGIGGLLLVLCAALFGLFVLFTVLQNRGG